VSHGTPFYYILGVIIYILNGNIYIFYSSLCKHFLKTPSNINILTRYFNKNSISRNSYISVLQKVPAEQENK